MRERGSGGVRWPRRSLLDLSLGFGVGSEMGVGRQVRGGNLLVARRLVEAGVAFVVGTLHRRGDARDGWAVSQARARVRR